MSTNGSLWYGKNINFPGFLYKKNGGAGVRRNPSYGAICNQPTDINNKYVSGSGVGSTTISNRRLKKRLASKCCDKPPLYSYSGTFVYSFTLVGTPQLLAAATNKFKALNPNDTIQQRPININEYIKPYLPISEKDGRIKYSYAARLYSNMFAVVQIDYTFIDDNVTTDGLQFTLDDENTLQTFYNSQTTNLRVHQFGKIPLSRYTTAHGYPSGSQFSQLQVDFVAKDAPSILSNTSLSFCFSNENFEVLVFVDISSWDVSNAISMDSMFLNASTFNSDLSKWNTKKVRSMKSMFSYCASFESDLSKWDVRNVRDMSSMFYRNVRFTSDLSKWNVSNVTNMNSMFSDENVFVSDLSKWDVSNVIDMGSMFNGASVFNSDLSAWDVSRVTDMSSMFNGANEFNSDLSAWDVSSVTNMNSMFAKCFLFNSELATWDTSNVIDMGSMFEIAVAFNSDVSTWDVSNVINMRAMFLQAYAFNQPLTNWDTSKVTNMSLMFSVAYNFNSDISNWDTGNVTNMSAMFEQAGAFNTDISNWNTGNVTDMSFMFRFAYDFNPTALNWNTGNVTTMSGMFNTAGSFNADISSWDTGKVTDMNSMFSGASVFNSDISNWDVRNVINMSKMFNYASAFNSNIANWNTGNVTNMSSMFASTNLPNLDISNWDVRNVTDMTYMFVYSQNLTANLSAWTFNPDVNLVALFKNTNDFNIILPNVTSYKIGGVFSQTINFQGDVSGWTINVDPDPYINSTITYMFSATTDFGANISNWTVYPQNFEGIFYESSGFNGVGLNSWTINPTTMWAMFRGASNFNVDLSGWGNQLNSLINLDYLFAGITDTSQFTPQGLNAWNISNVTSLVGLFQATGNAGQPGFPLDFAQSWDVSNVTDVSHMLEVSSGFTYDFSNWVSKLTNLNNMQYFLTGTSELNVTGLDLLVTSTVNDMSYMFRDTSGFNYDFVNNWNVSNVTNMSGLFSNVNNFALTLTWSVSNVTNMTSMFDGSTDFNNQFIQTWDTTNVTNMSAMFANSTNFGENVDLSAWNISNAVTIDNMFKGITNFMATGLDTWDTTNVTNMSGLFANTSNFAYTFVELWNTSNVTDMSYLFSNSSYIALDLSNWNVSNVKSIAHLFDGIIIDNSITNVFSMGLQNWNTGNVENAAYMFANLSDFNGWFIENWDVSSVTDMSNLFFYDEPIFSPRPPRTNGFVADLSNWDVSRVATMGYMFDSRNVDNVTIFNGTGLDKWVTSELKDMSYMFANTIAFDASFTKNWDVTKVETMQGLFYQSTSITIDASNWVTSSLTDLSKFMAWLERSSYISPVQSTIVGLEYLDTSNVTTLSQAFYRTRTVEAKFIEHWNMTSLANMTAMAQNATAFNPNLSLFAAQLNNVTDATGAFMRATSFFGTGMVYAKLNSLSSLQNMFNGCGLYSLGVSRLSSLLLGVKSANKNKTLMLSRPPQLPVAAIKQSTVGRVATPSLPTVTTAVAKSVFAGTPVKQVISVLFPSIKKIIARGSIN